MKHRKPDEFYVGYLERAPAGTGRFVARVALGLVAGGLALAALVAALQHPLPPVAFEFGHPRPFHGVVDTAGVPSLLVPLPGNHPADGGVTRLALVGQGKHGIGRAVGRLEGRAAHLAGSLIYRNDQTMLEVVPGSVGPDPSPARVGITPPTRRGRVTLRGEIVGGKCFLGVMNPGSGTTHRACAVRCISGGVPAMLSLRDSTGRATAVWLTGSRGRPLARRLLPLVAEPVELTGVLWSFDHQLVLEIDPASLTTDALIR